MRAPPKAVSLASALAALLLAGCRGCGGRAESHVDVPTTLDEVKKLHAPPAVAVSVERKTKAGGGVACGHSPICLLVVPVVAYQALFPDKWDEAKVVEAGAITYEGRFETNGALIEAVARKGGVARTIGVLPLEALGRRVVVEVARAPVGPDGVDGAFVRSPILPQVDLASAYRAGLAGEADAPDRAALLVEYGTWLGDEARPLLDEFVPKEVDASAAEVVAGLCHERPDEQRASLCGRVLAAVAAAPGPKTAARALDAALGGPGDEKPPAPPAPFAEALARHACEHPEAHVARDAARALGHVRARRHWPEAEPAARARAGACASESRRVLTELSLGLPASDAGLRAALGDNAIDAYVVELLDPQDARHRAAMAEAMRPRRQDEAYVNAFARSPKTPNGAELEALALSYAKDELLDDSPRRQTLLQLFARAKRDPAATAAARKALEAAVAAAKESDRPVLRAGLVVLGAREHAAGASRGLGGDDEGVIDVALKMAGCKDAEVREAAARARAGAVNDGDLGPLCTR